MSKTIEEFKDAKRKLESDVALAVRPLFDEFENTYGCSVAGIRVVFIEVTTFGSNKKQMAMGPVSVEVEL